MSPPLHLEPYDPAWAGLFALKREVLREALSAWIVGGIEHVGCTAVPGLLARPIIDIMVGVASLPESEPAIRVLDEEDASQLGGKGAEGCLVGRTALAA